MRGRIAPTPTGFLHLGHAATFLTAERRCHDAGGTLILRMEDLDTHRCRPEFERAIREDLQWLGISWQEGPDIGGAFGPYRQTERPAIYLHAWRKLMESGCIYPCTRSRKDVAASVSAPHGEDGEPLFPPEWRAHSDAASAFDDPDSVNWRFRVPDGRVVSFVDRRCGEFSKTAGEDFGDFLVWRRDGIPAYELAVVADDLAMQITEVVRGEDLLLSTCRQLLIYEALGGTPPAFFHTDLIRDADGCRLAKRDSALSLRALRDRGVPPEIVRKAALTGGIQQLGLRS